VKHLHSYLKQIKMPFFKNGEQEGKTGPVWGLAPVSVGDTRKGSRRGNIMEILCTHE
jgi:hypothetical protein